MDPRISSRRRSALTETVQLYGRPQSLELIEAHQVHALNGAWQRALADSSFYRHWQRSNDLPSVIRSLYDVQQFPTLTKRDLRAHQDLVFAGRDPLRYYETGGSTGEPVRFPKGGSEEDAQHYADNYVGRLWWGLRPYERSVLVWGHSHLYGTGPGRFGRRFRRLFLDSVGATLRLDGYQHDPGELRKQMRMLIGFRPKHLVGYSSALARLARIATDRDRAKLAGLHLKGVVVTAETLDAADEALLYHTYSCPIIIEYGAAEVGVIAVSHHETRNLRVLWGSTLITVGPENDVRVSTLAPRGFPLINYSLNDVIEPSSTTAAGSILGIRDVVGRVADVVCVQTQEGQRVIGALHLTHILKGHPDVEAVQFQQIASSRVRIYARLTDPERLDDVREHLARHLTRELPDLVLSAIDLVYARDQQSSRAGKHLLMIPPSLPRDS